MATKMRLQRFGKKAAPFYHIVIADGRAPRDGRFIEKIGSYNPITNPAEININFDKALDWLQKGVQPTDTVKAILSYKGILYKHHLLKGVKKGALTEAQAELKFQNWLAEKEAKIEANRQGIQEKDRNAKKEILEAESKINEAREAEISKKRQAEEDAKIKAAKEAAAAIEAENAAKVSEEVAEKIAPEETAPADVAEKAAPVEAAPVEVADKTETPAEESNKETAE
ncbi:MAG: 30S ribosomal protein S16 [Chlorobi bacterium]|nr:30S ribosomal protein S16 [Chlorobiota bacterium]